MREGKRRSNNTKQSSVTHNNIITANNVIINYNNGAKEQELALDETTGGADRVMMDQTIVAS